MCKTTIVKFKNEFKTNYIQDTQTYNINNIMLKIFLDTEFTGLNQQSSLISIALIAETGEEFYGELTDYDQHNISSWVIKNVLSQLNDKNATNILKGTQKEIAEGIKEWLNQFSKEGSSIQIWADCYAWDWILFCELFGGAFGIPSIIHYMPMDLATLFDIKTGKPDTSRFDFIKDEIFNKNWIQHHALHDAKVEKLCYDKLMRL